MQFEESTGHIIFHDITFYLLANASLQETKHPPLLPRAEREALFARCFARMHDIDSAAGWFHFPNPSAIKRDNFVEWILWALFGVQKNGLQAAWEEEIEGYISMIEGLLGRKLEQGGDDTIRCIKVSLDPVITVHRPLIWYTVGATFTNVYHLFRSRSTWYRSLR